MTSVYLPPEWAHQSATLLTWPHLQSDWAALIDDINRTFVVIATTLSHYQPTIISCFNHSHLEQIKCLLTNTDCNLDNILLFIAPSNDCWVRDHGPISVIRNGRRELINYTFNGWGYKFEAALDNDITLVLHKQGAFQPTNVSRLIHEDFVLEGGSIDVDGKGGLMTTSRCLLAASRNPDKTQMQIEMLLAQQLGVKRFYWLHHGNLVGDDTDGHIDTLARFVDEQTIVYSACNDPQDEQYSGLKKMEQELMLFRNWQEHPFTLIPLCTPKPIFNAQRQRLPANYTNFLFINHAVLVPTYNDPADKTTLNQFKRHFPDRKIIGLDSLSLIQQAGSLHCATMHLF